MKNTNKKKEIIPIFFAVDDRYVPHLTVALRSLIDNSSKRYVYEINILIDKLEESNKNLLFSMQTENVKISFFDVAERLKSICERLHMRDYYTKATYYRFFVPEMFTQYEKGVYLDCDIVITDDVARLYHAPMGKNLVAAVTDEIITDIEVFANYSERVLNIPKDEYFNAGILVMNLAEMRKYRIEEKFAKMLGERVYRVAQDQDYLNKLCRNRVFYLNQKWNKTPMPNSDRNAVPKIAHYKINFKPWRYDDIPYAELFWEYAKKTPFYNKFVEEKAGYSDAEKLRDSMQFSNLVDLAVKEVGDIASDNSDTEKLIFAEV